MAREWNYEKNQSSPYNYAPSSNKNVWWKCLENSCGCHIWETQICHRKNGSQCPFCMNMKLCAHNNLLAQNPIPYKEWDFELNELGPENYAPSSKYRAWWQTKCLGRAELVLGNVELIHVVTIYGMRQ